MAQKTIIKCLQVIQTAVNAYLMRLTVKLWLRWQLLESVASSEKKQANWRDADKDYLLSATFH